MIEFKAECGHTIRAKDEDEGKVVRCSYCGRETQVPVNEPDDLDSLFAEVEASESQAGAAVSRKTRRAMKRQAPTGTTPRTGAGFNPFAVALKMAYAAAILIVLIVAGRYAYQYWTSLDAGGGSQATKVTKAERRRNRSSSDGRNSRGLGLLTTRLNRKQGGIYVNSVPAGALIRVRKREADQGRITAVEMFADPDLETYKTNKPVDLKAGRYDVVVAVRVGDPHLMKYPGYRDLRRKIDQGRSTSAMLDGFFMPDGAYRAGTFEMANLGRLLYRQYEPEVIGKDWTPVTALFLPYGSLPSMAQYLPRKDAYGFDEAYVTGELDYHGVPKRDQKSLVNALRRVGMVVYQIPEEQLYRCFSVNLADGSIVYTTCEDPRPRSEGSAASGPSVGRRSAGSP